MFGSFFFFSSLSVVRLHSVLCILWLDFKPYTTQSWLRTHFNGQNSSFPSFVHQNWIFPVFVGCIHEPQFTCSDWILSMCHNCLCKFIFVSNRYLKISNSFISLIRFPIIKIICAWEMRISRNRCIATQKPNDSFFIKTNDFNISFFRPIPAIFMINEHVRGVVATTYEHLIVAVALPLGICTIPLSVCMCVLFVYEALYAMEMWTIVYNSSPRAISWEKKIITTAIAISCMRVLKNKRKKN